MTFPRSTLSVLIAMLFPESVSATSLYQEDGKLIRVLRAMGVLGDKLSSSTSTGTVSTKYVYLRHGLIAEVAK